MFDTSKANQLIIQQYRSKMDHERIYEFYTRETYELKAVTTKKYKASRMLRKSIKEK